MLRQDERLADGLPMRPVACRQCGAQVLARKASWEQTSVQWTAEAMAGCLERRAAVPAGGPNGDQFPGCTALRASIAQAALDGEITVLDDDAAE